MQTPLKISFEGSPPSDAVRRSIAEQAEALERFHGRLTACHVVVKVPGHHHRSGRHFEVAIRLTLPGNIVLNVDQAPALDGRFDDPRFAVADAFRRAQRQLENRVRRQRGDVKILHGRIERTLDEPPHP